jgi:4-carboxymuconolactone decarboxylase
MSFEPTGPIDRVANGQAVRRRVLGDEYVDSVSEPKTEAQAALQEMVAGFAWGTVWTRDQLSLRDRSLLNLAMLTALNRPHELAIHVKGALHNGLEPQEIEEALMHTGPYCGVPAAIDAMRTARPILEEWVANERTT